MSQSDREISKTISTIFLKIFGQIKEFQDEILFDALKTLLAVPSHILKKNKLIQEILP